jgi:hypothetical protein
VRLFIASERRERDFNFSISCGMVPVRELLARSRNKRLGKDEKFKS